MLESESQSQCSIATLKASLAEASRDPFILACLMLARVLTYGTPEDCATMCGLVALHFMEWFRVTERHRPTWPGWDDESGLPTAWTMFLMLNSLSFYTDIFKMTRRYNFSYWQMRLGACIMAYEAFMYHKYWAEKSKPDLKFYKRLNRVDMFSGWQPSRRLQAALRRKRIEASFYLSRSIIALFLVLIHVTGLKHHILVVDVVFETWLLTEWAGQVWFVRDCEQCSLGMAVDSDVEDNFS